MMNATIEAKYGCLLILATHSGGGVMALRDNRLLDSVIPGKSHGYGFFFGSNWIPRRRLGLVARFDQVRATTLEQNNTVRGETAAVIYDFWKNTRIIFEYQHLEHSLPTNLYRIAWQLKF
jgi:hypothetical protein